MDGLEGYLRVVLYYIFYEGLWMSFWLEGSMYMGVLRLQL